MSYAYTSKRAGCSKRVSTPLGPKIEALIESIREAYPANETIVVLGAVRICARRWTAYNPGIFGVRMHGVEDEGHGCQIAIHGSAHGCIKRHRNHVVGMVGDPVGQQSAANNLHR